MSVRLVVLFLFGISVQAFSQQSETRQLESFSGVKASEAVDVYLKKGDKESARVEVTGVELSDVVTELAGTTLKVHMRSGNFKNRKSVKVYVTYVKLQKVSASSAANIFSQDPIKTDRIEISVSSAGQVEVKLDAGIVTANASSAGQMVLEGTAKSVELEVVSAGDIDAYNLTGETVSAVAASAGMAKVSVSKELEAHASSAGDIRYRGNPTKTNTDSHSGGSVKKTN